MNELSYACMLASPDVRAAAENMASIIKWSEGTQQMVDYFLGLGTGIFPSKAQLKTILFDLGFEENEVQKISDHVDLYKTTEREVVKTLLESIDIYLRRIIVQNYFNDYSKGKMDIDTFQDRVSNLRKISDGLLEVKQYSKLDAETILEGEISGGVLPSVLDAVYEATPWKGYLKGQVVEVAAAPGAGKTSLMWNEAVNMVRNGHKVYYLSLGDMMESDFIIKGASLVKGVSLDKVSVNPLQYWDEEVRSQLNDLYFTVVPANYVTAKEVANFIITSVDRHYNVDAVMVDYDSNLKKLSDTMYEAGEEIYNALASIARMEKGNFKLVMIASQIKIPYWRSEIISKDASAESSKKGQIVDMMIGVSRPKESEHHFGSINIAKCRRGREGKLSYYELNDIGKIVPILKTEYFAYKGAES